MEIRHFSGHGLARGGGIIEFVTLLVLLLAVALSICYVLVFELWFLLRSDGFVSFGFCKSSQESGQCVFSGFDGLAKATCLHSAGPVCFFDSGMAILILFFIALFSFFQCIHFENTLVVV